MTTSKRRGATPRDVSCPACNAPPGDPCVTNRGTRNLENHEGRRRKARGEPYRERPPSLVETLREAIQEAPEPSVCPRCDGPMDERYARLRDGRWVPDDVCAKCRDEDIYGDNEAQCGGRR